MEVWMGSTLPLWEAHRCLFTHLHPPMASTLPPCKAKVRFSNPFANYDWVWEVDKMLTCQMWFVLYSWGTVGVGGAAVCRAAIAGRRVEGGRDFSGLRPPGGLRSSPKTLGASP